MSEVRRGAWRGTRLSSGGWVLAIVVSIVVLAALAVMPVDAVARPFVARLAGVAALAVFTAAAWRLPRQVRLIWWSLGAFLALTVIADLIYDYQLRTAGEVDSPGVTDVLYLATYLCALVGLVLLGRRLRPGRDLEAWIDTGIITTAAVSLVGTFIIAPLVEAAGALDAADAVLIVYPVLDLLLVAALVRIAFDAGGRQPAIALLMAAMALFLTADLIYQAMSVSDAWNGEPPLLEVLWTAALICIALAVLAPGATALADRPGKHADDSVQLRIMALGVAVLTTPVLLSLALWLGETSLAAWLSFVTIVVVVLLLWRISVMVRLIQDQAHRERQLAALDSLTGLPNRRTWDGEVTHVVAQCRRRGWPVTMAILDLDHFKAFNDSHGHQVGDDLLADAAYAWRQELDGGDILARYGGEEFGLLLPGVPLAGAVDKLERLRHVMPMGQTVSIGAAQVLPDEDPITTFRRADVALYRAKADGRNCLRLDQSATDADSGPRTN